MNWLRACAALLLLAPLAVGAQKRDAFKSGTFDPPRAAPELALEGSNGTTLNLARYRGKVVALAFGFTHCRKVCPLTLTNLATATTALGSQARDLQIIFVTVDPERDSVKRLREYLGQFHPGFVGATGTREQLAAVRRAYGITVKKEKENAEDKQLGYQVHHSSFVYLIDRAGKLRLLVPFGKAPSDIAHDLELLLKETPSGAGGAG
jgi:protein SCO1/2